VAEEGNQKRAGRWRAIKNGSRGREPEEAQANEGKQKKTVEVGQHRTAEKCSRRKTARRRQKLYASRGHQL
jgi:hypothetical protein